MLDDASVACILSLIYLVINLVAAKHQLFAAFMLDDVPTAWEKRLAKKCKRVLAPYREMFLFVMVHQQIIWFQGIDWRK